MFEYRKLGNDDYEMTRKFTYEWDYLKLPFYPYERTQLVQDYVIMYTGIVLFEGYRWDGATGAIDTDTIMKASAVHDALCDARNSGGIPNTLRVRICIDQLLYKICRDSGMSRFRATYVYLSVRLFRRVKVWVKGRMK